MRRAAEAVAAALSGAGLGAAAWTLAGGVTGRSSTGGSITTGPVGGGSRGRHCARPARSTVDLALAGAIVAGANGALCGWRGIYSWRSPGGVAAFVLDSTWASLTTAAGVVAHVAGLVAPRRAGYVPALSERQGRVVHRRGLVPRRGFAITLGNVVNGAGDVGRPRRRRLVTDHEDVHVWQARWFGPLFPLLYGGWMLVGAVVGVGLWALRRPSAPLGRVVETCAYYLNPFEWWAYSRDDHWPPAGAVAELAWRRPMVRPRSDDRAGRAAPR